jgi:hypothetical protein
LTFGLANLLLKGKLIIIMLLTIYCITVFIIIFRYKVAKVDQLETALGKALREKANKPPKVIID